MSLLGRELSELVDQNNEWEPFLEPSNYRNYYQVREIRSLDLAVTYLGVQLTKREYQVVEALETNKTNPLTIVNISSFSETEFKRQITASYVEEGQIIEIKSDFPLLALRYLVPEIEMEDNWSTLLEASDDEIMGVFQVYVLDLLPSHFQGSL